MQRFHESPSVGLGNPTLVQTWDAIVTGLTEEFDGNDLLFFEVVQRSQMQLRSLTEQQVTITPTNYFETLKNNMLQKDVLDFLIAIMDIIRYHVDFGRVGMADILRRYKDQLESYKKTLADKDREDERFVGREEYIQRITDTFMDDRSRTKVISICGFGGHGKTSLAKKICRSFSQRWQICTVDLREKDSILDMLKDVVLELVQKYQHTDRPGGYLIKETEEEIFEQLEDVVTTIINKKTILLLDNVDQVQKSNGNMFVSILDRITHLLSDQGDKCLMRILITSRYKLTEKGSVAQRISEFIWKNKLVEEIELRPLKKQNAVKLFKMNVKEGQVENRYMEDIVQYCGYSPLAIIAIASSIRYGVSNPHTVVKNLKQKSLLLGSAAPEILAVTQCLQQSFDTLNGELQMKLLQLSLFHTAPFDLFAAASIFDEPKFGGQIIGTQTKLFLTELKSFHLIEVHDSEDRSKYRYSLHPLMYHFLSEYLKNDNTLSEEKAAAMTKAKERFFLYYRDIIRKIGMVMDENCMKGQYMLGEHRVHVVNFYTVSKQVQVYDAEYTNEVVMAEKRMSDLADMLLYDDEKFDLLKIWVHQASKSRHELQYVTWRTEEAQKFLDVDRNEIVIDILNETEKKFVNIKGNTSVLPAVLASFYFLKGRYYLRENKSKESIENLKLAAKLCRIKEIKKDFRFTLSRILNALGCAYYKLKEDLEYIAKSRQYHQFALEVMCKEKDSYWNLELPTYLNNLGTCWYEEAEILDKNMQKDEARIKYDKSIQQYDQAIRLDIQMNQNQMDCHAQVRLNRAKSYMAIEKFDKAEEDMRESLKLRRKTLSPPHVQITVTTHKMGELLYKKGVHLFHRGKSFKEEAINAIYEAVMYYEMTMDHVRNGGMPKNHKEYKKIKEFHEKALIKVQDKDKLKAMKKFYQQFEKGHFTEKSKKRRSRKETTKRPLTQSDILAAITGAPGQAIGNSTDDLSSDGSGDNRSDSEPETSCLNTAVKFNKNEEKVNFDSLLKGIPDEDDDGKDNDVSETRDDIEMTDLDRHLKGVDMGSGMEAASADVEIKEKTPSVTDYVQAVNDQVQDDFHTNTFRTTTLPRQQSSQDDVFGNPKYLSQETGNQVDADTKSIVEDNLREIQSQSKRESFRNTSMQTSSLELSFDKDSVISADQYVHKTKQKKNILQRMESVDERDQEEEEMVTEPSKQKPAYIPKPQLIEGTKKRQHSLNQDKTESADKKPMPN